MILLLRYYLFLFVCSNTSSKIQSLLLILLVQWTYSECSGFWSMSLFHQFSTNSRENFLANFAHLRENFLFGSYHRSWCLSIYFWLNNSCNCNYSFAIKFHAFRFTEQPFHEPVRNRHQEWNHWYIAKVFGQTVHTLYALLYQALILSFKPGRVMKLNHISYSTRLKI